MDVHIEESWHFLHSNSFRFCSGQMIKAFPAVNGFSDTFGWLQLHSIKPHTYTKNAAFGDPPPSFVAKGALEIYFWILYLSIYIIYLIIWSPKGMSSFELYLLTPDIVHLKPPSPKHWSFEPDRVCFWRRNIGKALLNIKSEVIVVFSTNMAECTRNCCQEQVKQYGRQCLLLHFKKLLYLFLIIHLSLLLLNIF